MLSLVVVLRWTLVLLTGCTLSLNIAGLWVPVPEDLAGHTALVIYVVAIVLAVLRALFVATQRWAWAALSASLCLYVSADVSAWLTTRDGTELPFPSYADVGWLLFYPAALVGILLLLLDRAPVWPTLLDGAMAGLGGAAVFCAVFLDVMVGDRELGHWTWYLALAYPVCDALLVGTLAAQLALGRWAGSQSTLVLAGFAMFVGADTVSAFGIYNQYQSTAVDALYLLGVASLGLASSRRPRADRRPGESRPQRVSVWFALGALMVLLVASRTRMSMITVVFAGLTLVVVVLRVLAIFRDLEAAGRVRHLEARRDALTGLANRRAVLEHLDGLPEQDDPGTAALLLLDLNRFKQVNDTYGHQAGDDLLRQVAGRLQQATRPTDLVGRLGGDEFVVLAGGESIARKDVTGLALRIREGLSGAYAVGGPAGEVAVSIDVSIGIALRSGPDVDALLRDADVAMYRAKRAGGGHVWFDEPGSTPAEPAPERVVVASVS